MIILTDKTLIIPVGISPNYSGASGKPDLEDKSVEITENGDYSYTASAHYDGIGNFNVKVNVEIPVESSKTVNPSFVEDVTVLPSEGFDAMSSVIVKKAEANLQDKTVDKASTSQIVLTADEGYQGLGTVTVAPIKTKTVSADPSTNVQEFSANTENNEYITSVTVNPVGTKTVTLDPSTNSQTVNANTEGNEYISTVTVNPVGTKTVTVDSSTNAQTVNANVEGNEYITSVTVNPVKTKSLSITPRLVEQTFTAEQELYKTVNVSAVKYTEKTYDASTNTQTYDYTQNDYTFIKNLTINPVTSSIDPNIVPENIAKGVNILGVEGTVDKFQIENSKTVNPSFVEDVTVTPSEGFDGMSSVIVKKAEVNLQDKNVDKASTSQIVLTADEGYQGLGTVTIAPIHLIEGTITPTSGDSMLSSDTNNNEYISSVLVRGVPQKTLTADPSTNEQTFNSNHSSGEFYSQVIVNPVTSNIDPNIVPENIAKGVSIIGVEGTLEQGLPSELQEIINKGPAYSSKIKIYGVYTEDKSTAYDVRYDNFTNNAGVSGYIPFFQKNVKYDNGYPSNDTLANSLGTLADRGIVAYTVNGVLYTNPTSFNIPYTKVKNGNNYYDEVTVDVYIEFIKANARAEIIENAFLSDNGITTPVNPNKFDMYTYRYLPPIYNSNEIEYYSSSSKKIFEFAETYVREQVNALSALFISGYSSKINSAAGEIKFLTSKDGIKRVPDALSQRYFTVFRYVTFYGKVIDFKNLQYWFNKSQRFYVYGDIYGYDGIFQESSKNFFGNVNRPTGYFKNYPGNFLDKINGIILDIGERVDANPTVWNGAALISKVALFPNTLQYLYDNYVNGSKNRSYYSCEYYVFFGTTPPTMPDVDGNPQLLLQTGTTNISNNKLTTIYKPAGADYSSILDPTNPPTVIDFTPITSTTEVTGPGIYGLTYGGDKGYHWLFEIKESAQGEQDLQTIANELNNL